MNNTLDSKNIHINHYYDDCECHIERVIQATIPDFRSMYKRAWQPRQECFRSRTQEREGSLGESYDNMNLRETIPNSKNFNISVPYCISRVNGTPILDACNALEKHTGYKIIKSSEAEDYVREYTEETVHTFLENVPPVIQGAFGNDYFLKREVMWFCVHHEVSRCNFCGDRHCQDYSCKENRWDFERTNQICECYVYFLFHPATAQVKIGHSKNPMTRIQSHRSANAGDVKCLGIIEGSVFLEKNIHYDLSPWKASGKAEWFYYTDPVEKYIERMLSCVNHFKNVDK